MHKMKGNNGRERPRRMREKLMMWYDLPPATYASVLSCHCLKKTLFVMSTCAKLLAAEALSKSRAEITAFYPTSELRRSKLPLWNHRKATLIRGKRKKVEGGDAFVSLWRARRRWERNGTGKTSSTTNTSNPTVRLHVYDLVFSAAFY